MISPLLSFLWMTCLILAHASALSTPPSLSLISTPSLGMWSWHCTQADGWMVPEIKLEDCKGVLDYLFLETWDGTERRSREFTAPGATRKTKSATQWTPRKYTFGTCTLAIVMVADYPDPKSLPGGRRTGPESDTATYFNIWRTAKNVVDMCVEWGKVGWQPTGVHQGIGVFIWSTGSHEDQVIEADEPRLAFLSSKPPANGTVAST